MKDFKIGDKVVFKKEVLDKLSKTGCADSLVGCSLTKSYFDFLKSNTDFEKLGYYEVLGFDSFSLDIGLYIGKDLFEHYQEKYSYKKGDKLIIAGYEGIINVNASYYLNFFDHSETCKKIKKLFGENEFIAIAYKYNCINHFGFFPEFKSIDDLVNFVKELNKLLDSKKESYSITTKKDQNNEIRFQKPKASSIRGSVPTGRAICGRRRQTTIELGHLSNTTCYC